MLLLFFSLGRYVPHVLKPVRLGYGVEEVDVVVLGTTVMGTEVMIVEPWELVVVRFANEVAVVGAVLFVVAEVLVPELEVLLASDDCAAEGVGEKEERTERRKRRRE